MRDKFDQEFRIKLTTKEKQEIAQRLAACITEKRGAEAELKDVTARAKARVAEAEGRLNDLSDKLHSGHEYREVPCWEEEDLKEKRINSLRGDTGEVFESREMTAKERQHILPLRSVENPTP